MSALENFNEKSYEQHSEHFKKYCSEDDLREKAKRWFDNDTVNNWRQNRLYQSINPIIRISPKARWLTVGDGRYGMDAKYIIENGGGALATDISDYLLKEAKSTGFIPDFKKENAESLSFENSSFDYVFCKESYHHFPRPTIALYEMLRVAKEAVLLIEPSDRYISDGILEILFRGIKNFMVSLFYKKTAKHSFEESGNYVFCISKREMEKVALGLNYRTVAIKGINDAYFPGVETEKLSDNGPLQKKTRRIINFANLLCKLRLMNYGILAVIIFKKQPSKELLKQLKKEKYTIINLPENPYISK